MDQHVSDLADEDRALEALNADVARRMGEITITPDELPALQEDVERWRLTTIALAERLGAGRTVHFLRIIPIAEFDVPDTTGMSRDEELDAYYDASDATYKVTGYRLEVVPETTERVAEAVAKIPLIRARLQARRQAWAKTESPAGASRRRGPRRRGAGRPGHRSRNRANAPPASDDDPAAELEPDPVARRLWRWAFCCGLTAAFKRGGRR